jgi:hypothetical protein
MALPSEFDASGTDMSDSSPRRREGKGMSAPRLSPTIAASDTNATLTAEIDVGMLLSLANILCAAVSSSLPTIFGVLKS